MNRISTRRLLQPLLIGAAFLIASAPALAIKPFTANYQASYMGLQGDGQMTLRPPAETAGSTRSPSAVRWRS